MISMKSASPKKIITIAVLTIFSAETIVMLIIQGLEINHYLASILDATILSVIALPVFYFYIYKPLTIANTELAENESKLKTIINTTPAGFYQTDKAGRCTFANETWLQMAGLSWPEALDYGWQKGIHPEDRQLIFDSWNDMVDSNGQWGLEYRFKDMQGNVTWVYGLAKPIMDNQKKISGYLGINMDITKLKRLSIEKEALISRLQRALEEIKTLRGILPICMYCKEIRDDSGYWNRLEQYISDHSEAQFSHSICPKCLAQRHPQLAAKVK